VDRLGDVEPLPGSIEVREQVRVEQRADVRDHPVVAGLDRLVGPQAVDAPPHDRDLSSDPVDHLLQRPFDA
jgi:hypothetical protein